MFATVCSDYLPYILMLFFIKTVYEHER